MPHVYVVWSFWDFIKGFLWMGLFISIAVAFVYFKWIRK